MFIGRRVVGVSIWVVWYVFPFSFPLSGFGGMIGGWRLIGSRMWITGAILEISSSRHSIRHRRGACLIVGTAWGRWHSWLELIKCLRSQHSLQLGVGKGKAAGWARRYLECLWTGHWNSHCVITLQIGDGIWGIGICILEFGIAVAFSCFYGDEWKWKEKIRWDKEMKLCMYNQALAGIFSHSNIKKNSIMNNESFKCWLQVV